MICLSIVTVVKGDLGRLRKTIRSVPIHPKVQHLIKLLPYDISSEDLLSEFPHLNVHVLDDRGIYDAMNQSIALASGDWLLFLNAGDTLMPGVIDLLVYFSQCPDDFLGFKFLASVDGCVLVERASPLYFTRHMLNHQSILYSRAAFNECKFDPGLKVVGDLKHCLESGLYDSLGYVDLPIILYDTICNYALKPSSIKRNWSERLRAYRWRVSPYVALLISLIACIGYLHSHILRPWLSVSKHSS